MRFFGDCNAGAKKPRYLLGTEAEWLTPTREVDPTARTLIRFDNMHETQEFGG
jgi:hypothetical protein